MISEAVQGDRLAAFPGLRLESADFERVAEYYNLARTKGIQGSDTGFFQVGKFMPASIFTRPHTSPE